MTSKRFSHYITKNKRQVFPRYCVFVDTETKQIPISNTEIRQELFLGVAQYVDYDSKDTEDEIVFYNPLDFWLWVVGKIHDRKKLYVFAHNQDFDFRVLEGFSKLKYLGFVQGKLIAESSAWICDFKYDNDLPVWYNGKRRRSSNNFRCSIQTLDTTNWFKASLDSLGKIIGHKKFKMPSYEAPMSEWITYCRQDVVVLRKVFENYVDFLITQNMGNFGFTLAKQSFNCFRHRFMQHQILVHCNEKVTQLERESYYGGRTECWFIGHEKKDYYFKVDVNSMYPAVMQCNLFPTKLKGMRRILSDDSRDNLDKNCLSISRCLIETNEPCIPYRMNKRLCFPIGKFEATLCSPEIELARERGCKIKIKDTAYYEGEYLFKDWVNYFYPLRKKLREEGNEQYQYFVKIIMNSLYGKFGQKNTDWKQQEIVDDGKSWYRQITDMETGETETLKSINGTIYKANGEHDGFDTIVSIASFVTSYSRVMMYRFILQAGIDNCYYSDTDSLIVNRLGWENLQNKIDQTKLGWLGLEAHDNEVQIYNLKDYIFADEIKLKGVPHRAVWNTKGYYECQQWEHMNGAIQKERLETVVTAMVEKRMKRIYTKGCIQPNGRVQPFELPLTDDM